MLVTLDTAHFERSLLNTDAVRNAVQSITIIQKGKNRPEQIPMKKKVENDISDIVCYNKMEKTIKNNTRKKETKN